MKFRNYCIVVMGNTDKCKSEIEKISEGSLRYVPGRNIVLCTFVSVVSVNELREYFKTFDRNFLLFELDNQTSAFNIKDKSLENDLFGHINEEHFNNLYKMSEELMDEIYNGEKITGHTLGNNRTTTIELEIQTMNNVELQNTMNSILNKGKDNITEEDKRILNLISKKI